MDDLLNTLREFDALRDGSDGDIVHQRSLPAIKPVYADAAAINLVGPRMRGALRSYGIEKLYQHQADAIKRARGANVVLQAPTASGKTLAFQVPMLEAIQKRDTHALMIYPNKALALDQRDQLLRLTNHMTGRRIESWWYDGDVTSVQRRAIRDNPPAVLITNPDMLHLSFLGHADKWSRFLSGLRWVVVDEIHEYRGYFGSNVALILRRFSNHLSSRGVNPRFFLSSATCSNAKEHAENLTGREFVVVNAVNNMRPCRQFVFVQPNIPDYQYWDILQLRAVRAGLALMSRGKSVLVFCPTRKFTEACHRIAMRLVEEQNEENRLVNPDWIKVFRGGLSIDERHTVQQGLKNGTVRLVFTTNALEMGIDIGGLDGIIMAGFPDSIMSAWQRIGRAGRSWDANAFVLYYSRNDPLDRFYAENLDVFLDKPLDDLVVNPENEDLVEKHLPSLLFETPVTVDDGRFLGSAMNRAVSEKLRTGAAVVRSGRYIPHTALSVRGSGSGMYTLKEGNREIGTLSGQQQFREAYERAIYMHGGRSFRVNEISQTGNGGEIRLGSVDPGLKTNAKTATFVTEREIYEGHRWETDGSIITAFYGNALITEVLNEVEEVDERTGEVVDWWKPGFNTAQFDNAHAFWVSDEFPSTLAAQGVGAFQHLLRVGSLFSIPLDAHDVYAHAVLKEQKAYIVESYPGGIGIAKKVLELWRSVLDVGIGVAERCRCRKGCPNCIVPPRSRTDVDKVAGIRLARQVIARTSRPADYEFRGGFWEPRH